jgi:hypothetical protein
MFVTELANQESILLTKPSMNDMTIDCADPTTTSCQAAKAARQSAIESDLETAYNAAGAVAADETLPIAAAYICFWFTADAICQYAFYNGWKSCSYCPE